MPCVIRRTQKKERKDMKNNILKGYRYPFAIVGFGGEPRWWWMRFLKKGFYHCFVVLGNGFDWILIDPLAHFTDTIILKNVNIKGYLRSQGYQLVLTTPQVPPYTKARFRPHTCVETVKRLLGIKNPYILTPYQLFQFLSKKKGK